MKIHCSTFVLAVAAGLCVAAGAHAAPRTSGNPPTSAKPRLSEAQLAEVQARAALADAQAKGLDDSWRVNLLSSLYNTPSRALRDIRSAAKTLNDAHAQIIEARSRAVAVSTARATADAAVAAGLGSSTDSLVFTPMTPCRFIDTRVIGGPVGTLPRSFDTSNSGATYGGSAGCGLPGSGEPAIAANITIANPSAAAGYLSIRPFGSTNVTSWLNWYQSGEVTANAGIVAASPAGSSHYTFEVLTGGGTVDVVLDYFGYFSASAPASCATQQPETVVLPAGFNGIHTTTATCPAGTVATAADCNNGNAGVFLGSIGSDASGTFCGWSNTTNSAATVTQSVRCCQWP